MNAAISNAVKAEFGLRVLELPNKNYTSMIDSTSDLYLLGLGHTLIVSDGSTFGEVAWWLSSKYY